MTLRHAVLGLAVVFGFSVWSACRPGGEVVRRRGADQVFTADEAAGAGGNHDEAARRYKASQSTHWRQVAIGNRP